MLKKLLIGLFCISSNCFASSMEAWFCNVSWDYAVVNLETQAKTFGDLYPKDRFYDPWGDYFDGKLSKSITLDSAGTPYFISTKTSSICRLDVATEINYPVVDIAGIKTIEVAGSSIYAMTDSSLYRYNSGIVSKLCDIGSFYDIAVSPSGRIIGVKSAETTTGGGTHPIPNDISNPPTPGDWDWSQPGTGGTTTTGTTYGLYEIDPLTGNATSLINDPYILSSGSSSVTAYVDGQAIGLDTVHISNICFANDGSFWMTTYDYVYQVDLDNVLTATSSSGIPVIPGGGGFGGIGGIVWPPIQSVTTYKYLDVTKFAAVPLNYGYGEYSQSFDVFVTPEPLSAAMLIAGSIILSRRKNTLQ